MKIVSWNVNSINARQEHVQKYLEEESPDVLMLQELKTTDFPSDFFQTLGYESLSCGQKTYNGVAVLSKTPLHPVHNTLPGDPTDEQARYLEFETERYRIINIYAPNGNPVDSDKFEYKLAWLERFKNHLQSLRNADIPFIIGGDFNIIPAPIDCHNVNRWKDDALYRLESRKYFRSFINLGLTDALRVYNTGKEQYTFWDYRNGDWPKNHGIRIDHFLVSPLMTDRLHGCRIDTNPRGWTKPSDHTPIILEIKS